MRRFQSRIRRIRDLTILLGAGLALACGGSGGGSGTDTGAFVDSPVGGLRYTGDHFSGVTDAAGHYAFESGDEVCFFVDLLPLGCLVAESPGIVTPMDIFGGASDDDAVMNMVRLLLSLDADGDPSNGIDVSGISMPDVLELDFEQTPGDFETDTDVLAFVGTYGFDGELVDGETASIHFEASLEESDYFEQDMVGRWLYTRDSGSWPAESRLFDIALSDVDLLDLDVDELGNVSFKKSVGDQPCTHDGDFDGDLLVTGSITCGAPAKQVATRVIGDGFRMDLLVPGTSYGIADLSAPGAWVAYSTLVGEDTFVFDAEGIAATSASVSPGGSVRFGMSLQLQSVENCLFEGRMNSSKSFVSGDITCPSAEAAFSMNALF